MATASHERSNLFTRWIQGESHPALVEHFSRDHCDRFLSDDLIAGQSVSAVLVAVVSVGALLMAATVAWIVTYAP